jgi:zinc/manganese transport system substrate-binding protein
MKRRITTILTLWLLTLALPAQAKLNLFACEPEWAALASELGGEQVEVYAATTALQDPHHIEARPSLIAKVRKADLLVCSGAELEIGWLPMLQRQAGNPQVLPGRPGYFAASDFVERLDVPDKVDRSMGDVHASGNPHVHLDPRRLLQIAKALSQRLQELDSDRSDVYRQRMDDFEQRWRLAMQRWEARAAPLQGIRVVVHHRDWSYLFEWLGLLEAGTLEPRPGLPTSAGHLVELKDALAETPARLIIHTAYQTDRPAKRLAEMSAIPVVELPYTIGGAPGTDDLFGLYDVTLQRLLEVVR